MLVAHERPSEGQRWESSQVRGLLDGQTWQAEAEGGGRLGWDGGSGTGKCFRAIPIWVLIRFMRA